ELADLLAQVLRHDAGDLAADLELLLGGRRVLSHPHEPRADRHTGERDRDPHRAPDAAPHRSAAIPCPLSAVMSHFECSLVRSVSVPRPHGGTPPTPGALPGQLSSVSAARHPPHKWRDAL